MFTPAGLQDDPDVLQKDGSTELKLQAKRDLHSGDNKVQRNKSLIYYMALKTIWYFIFLSVFL